ncbi:MAG TPA: FAD-dependent oxidoreductase [Thermoanaerobaculia bacterium]|nr:FAD-dependent oxidoreductase [Thermoanaerobaculia bacterium]
MSRTPARVAIVGGGCAGVTAAWELTRPEHRGRFAVTLYQMGWRLGGKGASGRGHHARIEEHGLHLWMGFYENAFRLLRECYAELGRDPRTCRLADWTDAFVPDPDVGVAERRGGPGGESWRPWISHIPPAPGLPGDPLERNNPYTLPAYLARCAVLLRELLASAGSGVATSTSAPGAAGGTPPGDAEDLFAGVDRAGRLGVLATWTALLEGARLLEGAARLAGFPSAPLLRLLDAVGAGAARQLERLTGRDDELRRIWEIVDLILAFMRGVVREGLLTDPRGLSAIDHYDCREWLLLHGASRRTLDSAFVRGLYDLTFAFEGGDVSRPRMAAGQGLRGMVRMFFTSRGAVFWKLRAGMGDVVFAPFYQALRARGVRFELFHRLDRVRLAAADRLAPREKPYVEALDFGVQAEVPGGEYRPLVDLDGLPCWPAEPDWAQLADGERLRAQGRRFESPGDRRGERPRTLRVGEDFDFVVLAVGPGAVPETCAELIERDQRWRAMTERCRTVATQALQIWVREDLEGLGWNGPPVNLSGFVEPFDTWADMSHLLPEERWPAPGPATLGYFCSVLPDALLGAPDAGGDPERAQRLVREHAVGFLERDLRHLWPGAVDAAGRFRWELLVAPDEPGDAEVAGADRIDGQYYRANVEPSDRYALSLPGTLEYRISPLDNTIDNLTVAGDWTDCGHNAGCVEAAVISGRLAAHALSGRPRLEDIVGYDHP